MNRLAAVADGDVLLVVNPDVFVSRGSIAVLLSYFPEGANGRSSAGFSSRRAANPSPRPRDRSPPRGASHAGLSPAGMRRGRFPPRPRRCRRCRAPSSRSRAGCGVSWAASTRDISIRERISISSGEPLAAGRACGSIRPRRRGISAVRACARPRWRSTRCACPGRSGWFERAKGDVPPRSSARCCFCARSSPSCSTDFGFIAFRVGGGPGPRRSLRLAVAGEGDHRLRLPAEPERPE